MNNPNIAALAVARQRHATALEHMKVVLASRRKDRTVRSECKKYMEFIAANGLRVVGNSYISRLGVDSYFTRGKS